MIGERIKGICRLMLVGVACFITSNSWSADTIHVETAGSLSTLMETAGRSVKLTGFVNGTDIKFLRERISAGKLSTLDLADVRIVSGGSAYNESYTTRNDVIGDYMSRNWIRLSSTTLPPSDMPT